MLCWHKTGTKGGADFVGQEQPSESGGNKDVLMFKILNTNKISLLFCLCPIRQFPIGSDFQRRSSKMISALAKSETGK